MKRVADSGLDEAVAAGLERLEQRVWTDAYAAATPEIARRLGLAAEPVADGIALIASEVPHVLYNRAFAFGLGAPIDEATLDQAIARYRRDAPFSIQPSPIARPATVRDWLDARGLPSRADWMIGVLDMRAPIADPGGIRIDRIGRERARTWTDLASVIFEDEAPLGPWLECLVGRPSWVHYLAYDGPAPIGIGALFVDGERGWLGWGGTLPEHRRRGVQSALIARRVKDAEASGARWVRVETSPDLPDRPSTSYRNMIRAGFRFHARPSHTPAVVTQARRPGTGP